MEVTILRSKRKTISIQINPDLSLTVKAPIGASQKDIEKVLKEQEGWIQKHIEQIKEYEAKMKESNEGSNENSYFTPDEIRQLADQAMKYLPERVSHFSKIMGVSCGRLTIRNQRTRWGSCSSKGNLNFNCLLMLMPAAVIDYVVVHELCHLKEMNHSKAFWAEVEKVLPNYKEQVEWLKEHGGQIMKRQGRPLSLPQ